MSRSGYSDDYCDPLLLGRWRAQVASAIRGKRGQSMLRDTLEALDAMPVKALSANSFQSVDGDYCTLGALAAYRGIDVSDLEPYIDHILGDVEECDGDLVGARFNIARQLAQEIMYMNDDGFYGPESPEERWRRMRKWVAGQIHQHKEDAA